MSFKQAKHARTKKLLQDIKVERKCETSTCDFYDVKADCNCMFVMRWNKFELDTCPNF